MIRLIHRWISFPLILFLFLVTATGVVLQVEELGEIGGGGGQPPATSAIPADAELAALVTTATAAARSSRADFPAQNLLLDFSGGKQKARFGITPRGGASIEVDLRSGATKVIDKPRPSLHGFMVQLHTGRMFGPIGLIVMGVVSLIFLVLTVTGFIVYLDMWRRRKVAGKTELFWK